jgi:hypothetical protein
MTKRHCAQVVDGVVTRVIVGSPEWAAEHLGGEWVETDKTGATGVAYCGPSYGCDTSFPERFAPPWVMPAPDPETGVWSSYPKGALAWHAGQMWRSTCDNNVWEPGVSAWHPQSEIEGVLPDWIQPTGAHDSYPLDFEVRHAGQDWYCTGVDANGHNVWEPGVYGWTVIGQEPEPGETWIDTGATVTGQAGQLYYVSQPIVNLGLVEGQSIKLGDSETTYVATWPGVDNLMQINPFVTVVAGVSVWKLV